MAGNDYLALNDVYSWPVPMQGIRCDARKRLEEHKAMPNSKNNINNVCDDYGLIVKDDVSDADGQLAPSYMMRMEVQFHTECSLNIKQDATHDAYEIVRAMPMPSHTSPSAQPCLCECHLI